LKNIQCAIIIKITLRKSARPTCSKTAGFEWYDSGKSVPVPKSAIVSFTPTGHSTVVKDGAGVYASRRDRYGCSTCSKTAGERWCGFVRCASVTELAIVSISPTGHSTVVKNGAGVGASRRERYGRSTRPKTAGKCG